MDSGDLVPPLDDGLDFLHVPPIEDGLDMLDLSMPPAGSAHDRLGPLHVPLLGECRKLPLQCGPDFVDPFDQVKSERRLGTDKPVEWEPMQGCRNLERQLYHSAVRFSKGESESMYARECLSVLQRAFPVVLSPEPRSLEDAIGCIEERTQYRLVEIVRLQNPGLLSMQKHFALVHEIKETERRWVYHGTTNENAKRISDNGFRNAASQRAKFGKGIYSASNVWEALAYAEPEPASMVQTFLVAELVQGPTCVGTENKTDFGCDEAQRQIITATNPEQTIFCAAYESQLYAHYRIRVCFKVHELLKPSAQGIVLMYHPTIWSLVKSNLGRQSAPAATVFAVSLPTAGPASAPAPKPPKIPQVQELTCHMNFMLGDIVMVVQTLVKFKFAHHARGKIVKIVKAGKVHFFLEFDDPALREQTRGVNGSCKNSYHLHTDGSWLRCQLSHIVLVARVVNAASTTLASTSDKKRKR